MTETPPQVTTNDLIRGALAMRGYVQRDLARALGISQVGVSERLTGVQDWRLSELRKAAAFLRVDLGALASARPDFSEVVADDASEVSA